jgi:antitoxin (DNA-binding transcriptional repressor) of toxin-antitoxin stability system
MTTITLDKAEKQLAALVKRARSGEEIVISDGEEPGVKLAPLALKSSYRGRGVLAGKIAVADEDLFGPLPQDEIARWWGESGEK